MGTRDKRTTHPRKKARREGAMERFSVRAADITNADYMAAKLREWLALGGDTESFKAVPHKRLRLARVVS